MSWKVPYVLPRSGDVIDAIELDEMFKPFVEEFSRFNEQNFSSSMGSSVLTTELATDVAMSVDSISVASSGGAYGSESLASVLFEEITNFGSLTEQNAHTVNVTEDWTVVDSLEKTWVSFGGTLLLLANLQYIFNYGGSAPLPGLQVAFRVDGTVLREFAVGDYDDGDESPYMERGHTGWAGAADIEATLPLQPGAHVVEVVARLVPFGVEADRANLRQCYIFSRQLFVCEMR